MLVINTGSSSLKYSLVDAIDRRGSRGTGLVERIGESTGSLTHTGPGGLDASRSSVADHEEALAAGSLALRRARTQLDDGGPGRGRTPGGPRRQPASPRPPWSTTTCSSAVDRAGAALAPLHNPANLEGIEVARRMFPEVPHVAVFDTAFHQTLPPHAYTYARPAGLARGPPGSVATASTAPRSPSCPASAPHLLGRPVERANLIVLHLGNGASATAVSGGESVDTSMGLTPLEGLVMGTRVRRPRPCPPAHLHRELGWSIADIDRALNRESGLKGLVGHNDFRELIRLQRAPATEPRHPAPSTSTAYRIRKYVGAYYAVLGGWTRIVFTGGVGENVPGRARPPPVGARPPGDRGRPRPQRGAPGAAHDAVSPPTTPTSPCSSYPPTRSGRSPSRHCRCLSNQPASRSARVRAARPIAGSPGPVA